MCYDQGRMRQHLVHCFEAGIISQFPVKCRRTVEDVSCVCPGVDCTVHAARLMLQVTHGQMLGV